MHSEIPGDGVDAAQSSSGGTVATVAPFCTWIDEILLPFEYTLGLESTPALALYTVHTGTAPELIETALLLLLMQQLQPFVHSDNGTLMQELLMVLSDSAARRHE